MRKHARADTAAAPTAARRTSVILDPVHRKRVPMSRAGLRTSTVDTTNCTKREDEEVVEVEVMQHGSLPE